MSAPDASIVKRPPLSEALPAMGGLPISMDDHGAGGACAAAVELTKQFSATITAADHSSRRALSPWEDVRRNIPDCLATRSSQVATPAPQTSKHAARSDGGIRRRDRRNG